MNNVSIDYKIGQRFILGVNNNCIDDIVELIRKCHVGGVILYKQNYKDYSDMLAVINKLKAANKGNKLPLFISIDQEGGIVNRFPQEIHSLQNIYDVSKKDAKLVKNYADIISKLLNQIGINMNFSPVLDIYNNSKSKVLYKRCFYGDEYNVGNLSTEYVKKCSNNDVISVVKHFPGHGVSKLDSHFMVPYAFNYREVINKHMVPFNIAIKNGIDAIMIGHIVVRKLTGFLPASISDKFIKKYLANYKGLIITDEINMLRRNPFYKFCYLDKALKSSSDIVLIKIKDASEGYKIIDKYTKMISNDDNCKKQLDVSFKKIVYFKDKYNVNDNILYDKVNFDEINASIDKINVA